MSRIIYFLSLGLFLGCQSNLASNPSNSNHLKQSSSSIAIVESQSNLTYENKQLGFGFSYPQGYTIQEFPQGIFIWTDLDYQNQEDFIEATPFSIDVRENPDNLSPMEWVQTQNFQIEGKIAQRIVASSESVIFQWSGMWLFRSVAIPHGDANKIIFLTLDQEQLEYQEVFESILETFYVL